MNSELYLYRPKTLKQSYHSCYVTNIKNGIIYAFTWMTRESVANRSLVQHLKANGSLNMHMTLETPLNS